MFVPGNRNNRGGDGLVGQSGSRREGAGSSAIALSTMVPSGADNSTAYAEVRSTGGSSVNVGSSSSVGRVQVTRHVDNVHFSSDSRHEDKDDQNDEGEQEIGRGRLQDSSKKSSTKRRRGREDENYDLDDDDDDLDDSDQSDNRGRRRASGGRRESGGRNARGDSAKKGKGRNSRAGKEDEAAMTKATARQVEEDRRAETNREFKLSKGCVEQDCKDLEDTKVFTEKIDGVHKMAVALPDVSLNQYHIQILNNRNLLFISQIMFLFIYRILENLN
jgi:hypothetical protein